MSPAHRKGVSSICNQERLILACSSMQLDQSLCMDAEEFWDRKLKLLFTDWFEPLFLADPTGTFWVTQYKCGTQKHVVQCCCNFSEMQQHSLCEESDIRYHYILLPNFHSINAALRWMCTPYFFFFFLNIFEKGDYFCTFLFASLENIALLKLGLLIRVAPCWEGRQK